ncbi:oligopeptide ABC transporter ATP-binding protein [Spiroplasma sp. TIUS-1]|uniref:ATP-binding cassette domain-containing protein n=1 Tax=Spiroplasma sp. TIUS-1 TaxID=216963 RepID=UPI001397BF85|nr:ATP-binding cassette domain-containing protein [Spiroplasma sp. TIUS-1]QHX36087.1 oligopeptide ABC transporter ATP-binding protein [Spiroplasma sp. TIUS-1]
MAKTIVSVRDMVVEFRNKTKKFRALKGINVDIKEGTTFAVVGESGSGKTTFGRAVMGINKIHSGSVFFDDKLVFGKPLNLHKSNLQILDYIKAMEIEATQTATILNEYIDAVKVAYFLYIKNQKFNPKTKKLKDLKSEKIIIEDREVLVNEKSEKVFKKVENWQKEIVKALLEIIRIQQSTIRFLDHIDKYAKELTPEMFEAIRTKARNTHVLVRDVKTEANKIYLNVARVNQIRHDYLNEKLSLEKFFELILVELQKSAISQNKLQDAIEDIIWSQEQNIALTSKKKEREEFKEKFKALVNIKRSQFVEETTKYILDVENKKPGVSDVYLDEAKKLLSTVWSYKTVNIEAIKEYINSYESNTIEKNNELLNSFKNSDIELEIKNFHEEYVLKNIKNEEVIKSLKSKIDYVENLLNEDTIEDADTIKFVYAIKGWTYSMSEKMIKEYRDLIKLLDLESLDSIINNLDILKPLNKKGVHENKKIMQMIFQDPAASLNDRLPIIEIISEGLYNYPELYKNDESRKLFFEWYNKNHSDKPIKSMHRINDEDVRRFIIEQSIKSVGLLPEHLSRYPHEFSGGQRQRIGIARALVMKPKLIIADEPISALDVSIRAQVLNLFKKFQDDLKITYIFVAHDLSIVRHVADTIAVIYRGQIVEMAPAEELFNNPLHPYTRALLSAIPHPDPNQKEFNFIVYDEQKEHPDYLTDFPNFKQIKPGHYVWSNRRELVEMMKKIMDSNK